MYVPHFAPTRVHSRAKIATPFKNISKFDLHVIEIRNFRFQVYIRHNLINIFKFISYVMLRVSIVRS